MDDAAIKIERMCTRRCPRLCDVGRGNVGREVGRGAWGGRETSACIIYFGFISMVEKVTRVERYIYSKRSKVYRVRSRRWSGRWDAWEAEAIDFPSHVRCWRSSFVYPKRPASVDTSDLLSRPARHSRNSLVKPTFWIDLSYYASVSPMSSI